MKKIKAFIFKHCDHFYTPYLFFIAIGLVVSYFMHNTPAEKGIWIEEVLNPLIFNIGLVLGVLVYGAGNKLRKTTTIHKKLIHNMAALNLIDEEHALQQNIITAKDYKFKLLLYLFIAVVLYVLVPEAKLFIFGSMAFSFLPLLFLLLFFGDDTKYEIIENFTTEYSAHIAPYIKNNFSARQGFFDLGVDEDFYNIIDKIYPR